MTRLRVGIVGAGVGAEHLAAYAGLPDLYEITWLCALEADTRDRLSTQFSIPHTTDRYGDLLAADLDLIDICTPSALHAPQAIQAMEAGKDVVIEKPAARSLAEMDRLMQVEAATGRRASPIYQYRFGHGIQKLHHLMAHGVAGPVSVASAETHWKRDAEYYAAAPWRGTWAGETGGTFTTHAIHIHDLLCEVMGPVASVHARRTNRLNGRETEDMGVVSLSFASGAMATSSVTLGAQSDMSRLRICCADLTAESGRAPYAPGADPWVFETSATDDLDKALVGFVPQPEGFVGQFQRLHSALSQGTALPVNLSDARRSIELLTAIYWSAHSGTDVTLPLGRDHPFYAGWVDALDQGAER